MVLGKLAPSASSSKDTICLILSGGTLHVDYVDNSGTQHYIYTSATISSGTWYDIVLSQEEPADQPANDQVSSVSLYVDGAQVGTASGVDLGGYAAGSAWVAMGDEYSPNDPAIAGHMYDDSYMVTSDG